MRKLSLQSYVTKCIIGSEIVYVACLLGALLPLRSQRAVEIHRALFETLPGFTWLTAGSVIWGFIFVAILSAIFGSYMVWMHNSSLVEK